MGQAFREAMWEKGHRQTVEQAKLPAHLKATRGPNWRVYRVEADGKRVVIRQYLSPAQAESLAGQMRDRMSDAQVGLGIDYQAGK